MYKSLKDKRVVVTGGASGIGQATALRFMEENARVVIFDWNEAALAKMAADYPGIAGYVRVDVSSETSVRDGFARVDEILGGIDVLVSNAGISIRNDFKDVTLEQWKKVLGVNLDSMFLVSREALRRMEPQQSGVILMTASTNGMNGHEYYVDYNCSKAGVILLAKTLALEYAPHIRVNSVSPGYVLTPMQRAEYTDEMLAKVNDGIPLKRHAAPEEVAALYAFLASDQASYLTGINIPIDGGETA